MSGRRFVDVFWADSGTGEMEIAREVLNPTPVVAMLGRRHRRQGSPNGIGVVIRISHAEGARAKP